MKRERLIVLGVALTFYGLGGWSIYGEFHRQEVRAGGNWPSTDAMITEAYRRDIEQHDLKQPTLLGYQYIVRGISYRVHDAAAQRALAAAESTGESVRVRYKPEDPAVAIFAGSPTSPNYSTGIGLIGFGTLIALIRELILLRRGRYRPDGIPASWRALRKQGPRS